MYNDEQEVGVRLLVFDNSLVRQQPPRLELRDDFLEHRRRRVVDEVPKQCVVFDSIQQDEVQRVCAGHAPELPALRLPSFVSAGLRLRRLLLRGVRRRARIGTEVRRARARFALADDRLGEIVHPILGRDAIWLEDLDLRAVLDGLEEHVPMKDDDVQRAFRSDNAREDHGHAKKSEMTHLRATLQDCLWLGRRRQLRRILVQTHLVRALLAIGRKQPVLLEDV
mmetsp:Transcript_41730/g.120565  ORF Transcript_41730/g.120565 Transcript_41730/m.120565 type:complete len:224 (+) Transcript_41730:1540-2211(+)